MNTTSKTHNALGAFQSKAKRKMFFTTSNDSGFVSPKDHPPDSSGPGGDVLPHQHESVVFPVSQQMQANIRLSGNGVGPNSDPDMSSQNTVGQLIRPKSPTQQCSIPKPDASHFNLALMEPKVGSELSEHIFHVQQHELVCAISSETAYLDNEGCMLSSVDINYYWCNFCTFSTCTKTLLMQHVMEHRFHCKYCRYQSFSRADVIHHAALTHPEFQEVAAITKYCVLLSDYLRITHPQEKQLDSQRKRKHQVQDAGDTEEICHKMRNTGNKNVKQKVQEKFAADYILFDVGVEHSNTDEKVDEESRTRKKSNSSPPLLEEMSEELVSQEKGASSPPGPVSSAVSDPPSLFPKCELADSIPSVEPGDGQQTTHSVPELALPPQLMPEEPAPATFHQPPSCSASSNFSCATLSPSPSPPSLSSITIGSLPKVQSDWICAYCKFTCTSQNDMNVHCSRQHRGMPPKCVSPIELDERSAPPILKYLDGKLSCSAADQDCEMHSVHDDPFSSNHSNSVPDHIHVENGSADEPPVLVKQESVDSNVSSNSLEADIPVPKIETQTVSRLKCSHCSYTTHHLDRLRDHLIISHKGKSLTGLDSTSKQIFVCCKTSCEFTSSFGQSYLDHARNCIPWPVSESTSCQLEKGLVECLQATAQLAEHDALSSAHSSTTSFTGPVVKKSRNFSCTYCKNQYVSDKNQTKQHVLENHGSKTLVMRNVYAHSKKRRSTVYFCRWCSWEGERKTDHDMHSVFCPHQSKSTARRYNESKNAAAETCFESSSAVQVKNNTDINTGRKMERDDVHKQVDKHQDQECSGQDTSNPPSLASSAQDSSVDSSRFVHNEKVKNEDSESQTETSLQATTAADKHKLVQDLANDENDRPSFPMLSFGDSNFGPVEDFDVQKPSPNVSIPSDDTHHTALSSEGKLSPKSETHLSHNENSHDSSHYSHMSVDGSVTEETVHPPHVSPGETSRPSYCRLTSNTSSKESRAAGDVIDISDNSVESDMSHSLPDINDSMDRVTPQLSSGTEFAVNSNGSSASNDVISRGSSLSRSSFSADNSNSSVNTSQIPASPDACENRPSISHTKSPSNDSSHMNVHGNSVDPVLSKTTAGGSTEVTEQGNTGSAPNVFHSDTAQHSRQPVKHTNKHEVRSDPENSSDKKKDEKLSLSQRKKYKTVWCDGSKIRCTLCDFTSKSLTSLKVHILGNHSHLVSFPFKSVRHREKHYKSSFYACPSLECFMCNFDESVVVRHYRKHHTSQPHAYMDRAYVPAPLKGRRKTDTKPHEPKNQNSSSQPSSHTTKPHTHLKEKPYMCLYCDDRKYTDSVPGMKVHQLACHAGQAVIVRDVLAHREKRLSRIFVCDQPDCDFTSYERDRLNKHMKMQHAEQLLALADRSYQCVACGWIATDNSKVQRHVSAMHQSEGGATVVTLAHGDDQRAVEERFVKS